ncbi:hypothetical protein OROMI_006659 [Orobanche minor]
MAEVEGNYVDDGEYWVADYVMGMDISDFVRECGDKIFRTSILVFEMLKALVEGWNGLSDVGRKKAKDAIIQDTASKMGGISAKDLSLTKPYLSKYLMTCLLTCLMMMLMLILILILRVAYKLSHALLWLLPLQTSPSFIAAANFLLATYHSQAERSFIARGEKELTGKMESAGALRTVVENSRAKIEELENQLQKSLLQKNVLEIKLEEALQDSGTKDVKAGFQIMGSAISKEMGMMKAQLNRWKETTKESSFLHEKFNH